MGDKYDKTDERLLENVQLFKDWNGKDNGLITVMLGPHAPYTCGTEYLKLLADTAGELGCELHMHLAETEQEVPPPNPDGHPFSS